MRTTSLSRLAFAALISALTLFALAPAANAQPSDYPGDVTLTLDRTEADCGGTVVVTGTGYLPNAEVTITADGKVVGTAMTDGEGNFTFTYQVPPCPDSGDIRITASDGTNVLSVTLSVIDVVVPTTRAGATTPLPRTGTDNTNLVRLGAVLLAVGGLLVLAARKRSKTAVDA